jgi:hypothetical protein
MTARGYRDKGLLAGRVFLLRVIGLGWRDMLLQLPGATCFGCLQASSPPLELLY